MVAARPTSQRKKKREKTINKGEECNIYGGWTVEQPGKGEGWMH